MPVSVIYKVLLKGTLVALFRNPATSVLKGLAMLRNRGEMIAKPVLKIVPELGDDSRGDRDIEEVLDEMGLPSPVSGSIEFLIDGDAFFPNLYETVKNAEKSVDTRVFIFDNDDTAVEYADLLKEKAKEVDCRVMFDHLGSISAWFVDPDDESAVGDHLPDSIVDYLTETGEIQLRKSLNPFFVADHSKLFVIDKKIAYLGGMNVGYEYRHEWHDMMARVEGPIVADLQREYERAWSLQGGWGDWTSFWRKTEEPDTKPDPEEGEIKMRILATRPFKNQIESATVAAIRLCEDRLFMQNAYFTSDTILDEMIEAKKRGVDVRMVLPSNNDSKILAANNESIAGKLLEHDIKVYRYPRFSHIKATVADGWALIGSANLDTLSLRINEELSVAFSDSDTVERLVSELFEADFETAEPIEETEGKPITGSLIEALADQL